MPTHTPKVEVKAPPRMPPDKIHLYGLRFMNELKAKKLDFVGEKWWSEEELAELIDLDPALIRPILDALNRDGHLEAICPDPRNSKNKLYRYP